MKNEEVREELVQLLARVFFRMIRPPQNVPHSSPIALPVTPQDCSLSTVVNTQVSVEKKQ